MTYLKITVLLILVKLITSMRKLTYGLTGLLIEAIKYEQLSSLVHNTQIQPEISWCNCRTVNLSSMLFHV